MDERPIISESEFERKLDALVMARLRTDPAYSHAENAEDQSEAEEAISEYCHRELSSKYRIAGQYGGY